MPVLSSQTWLEILDKSMTPQNQEVDAEHITLSCHELRNIALCWKGLSEFKANEFVRCIIFSLTDLPWAEGQLSRIWIVKPDWLRWGMECWSMQAVK